MNNGDDPAARRRLDKDAMNERDERAWELQKRGWPVREIAGELQMPASSVQRCLQRTQKRRAETAQVQLEQELDAVVARYDDDDGMRAEDVRTTADVEQCNELELYRLRFFDPAEPSATRPAPSATRRWWSAAPRPGGFVRNAATERIRVPCVAHDVLH